MTFDEWEPWGLLVLGATGFVLGALTRLGYARRWFTLYWNRRVPATTRNSILAAIPYGAVFLLWLGGAVAADSGERSVALSLFALSVAALLIGLYVQLRAPDWAKPRWVREAERTGDRPPTPTLEMSSRGAAVGTGAVVGVALVLFAVTGSLAALAVGLGVAGGILGAIRIRRGG